jgi:signal peptidase II
MVQVATLFPEGGGYGTLLHGLVVDMFYFPLIEADFPEWLPIWGGEHFIFFSPVFNLADASISTGVGVFLLYQKHFFKEGKKES